MLDIMVNLRWKMLKKLYLYEIGLYSPPLGFMVGMPGKH